MVVATRLEIVEEEVKSSWPKAKLSFRSISPLNASQLVRAKTMCQNFERFRLSMSDIDWCKTEAPIFYDLGNGSALVGRTDLICGKGETLGIFDYKSSKAAWEHKKVPPQILRYAMAISRSENTPIERIGGYIINLESGNHVGQRYTQRQAQDMHAHVNSIVDQIKATSPENAAPNPGSYCRTLCGYAPSCKAYRKSWHWRSS